MARHYSVTRASAVRGGERRVALLAMLWATGAATVLSSFKVPPTILPFWILLMAGVAAYGWFKAGTIISRQIWLERERGAEKSRRKGRAVLGLPPKRGCFAEALAEARAQGKNMIDKYLVGFELETGEPLWIDEDALCTHAAVFAKTGVGKTLWLESLIFQQMARGRASGCTFIDAKRDSGTLAQIILMALVTGRIEDLIVVDPFDAVHSYNFVLTDQRADVKARKVLRAGLPPTSDASTTKHYDRLAADSIYRLVRAMESFGLAWSIHDIAVSLSAFSLSYPHLRSMLHKIGAREAMIELGHLASSYRTAKGGLDTARITDNLRGIASELHAVAGSEMGELFCTRYTDLVLTDAILRGKIIYFMLPRLEEAESAARMIKLFREDLEVSIGEITSSRLHHLEDPHLVIIDEGSSTFGPTWANLFELARKGRFALLFGAQSTGGLTDSQLGLSQAFYERVMANVNLKVMMRVGDNRTAMEMAEWFGKISTTRKSIGSGITKSKMGAGPLAPLDLRRKFGAGESQSISIMEDEEDLVSAEELKHEMSAEKGLAWFDLGDGRIVKGRSFWFDADLPDSWEGREFLTRFERYERDEIGIAAWVDEQILNEEQEKTSKLSVPRFNAPRSDDPTSSPSAKSEGSQIKELPDPTTPFKINLIPKGPRPRGIVSAYQVPAAPPVEEKEKRKESSSGGEPPSSGGGGKRRRRRRRGRGGGGPQSEG